MVEPEHVTQKLKSTSYGRILVMISCVLFVEAYLFTNLVPALAAMAVMLYLVYTKVDFKNTIKNLDIQMERTVLEKILFADRPFNVVLKMKSNPGMVHIELQDKIPRGCSLHEGKNRYSILVVPNKEYKFKYSVLAGERGRYKFEETRITLKDKSRLFQFSTEKELVSEIRVHSGTDTIKKAKAMAKVERLKETAKARERESGIKSFELDKIRDYLPGDRMKDIEWKSTSRLRKLMTKVFEEESAIPSIILLDCSKSMRKTTGEKSKMEHGIQLSLQLTKILMTTEHPTGLVAFDEHKVLSDIFPSTSHDQFEKIFNALLFIPNQIMVSEYDTISPIEPLPPKTEPDKRFIGILAPFFTRKKRKYTSVTQATGIYEAVRTLISAKKRSELLLLITDLETNLGSLHEAINLAKKHGNKMVVISPFTYWYDTYPEEVSPEILEKIYQSYTEKQKIIFQLRGAGVKVIEISPKDVAPKVIKEMERSR